jgi:hypothetical protein
VICTDIESIEAAFIPEEVRQRGLPAFATDTAAITV